MTIWIIVFVAAAVLAGLGFGGVCAMLRNRHVRLTLGIPEGANGNLDELQAKLAAKRLVDTEMQVHAAAPHLTPIQRRRLALALARTRGALPKAPAPR